MSKQSGNPGNKRFLHDTDQPRSINLSLSRQDIISGDVGPKHVRSFLRQADGYLTIPGITHLKVSVTDQIVKSLALCLQIYTNSPSKYIVLVVLPLLRLCSFHFASNFLDAALTLII